MMSKGLTSASCAFSATPSAMRSCSIEMVRSHKETGMHESNTPQELGRTATTVHDPTVTKLSKS